MKFRAILLSFVLFCSFAQDVPAMQSNSSGQEEMIENGLLEAAFYPGTVEDKKKRLERFGSGVNKRFRCIERYLGKCLLHIMASPVLVKSIGRKLAPLTYSRSRVPLKSLAALCQIPDADFTVQVQNPTSDDHGCTALIMFVKRALFLAKQKTGYLREYQETADSITAIAFLCGFYPTVLLEKYYKMPALGFSTRLKQLTHEFFYLFVPEEESTMRELLDENRLRSYEPGFFESARALVERESQAADSTEYEVLCEELTSIFSAVAKYKYELDGFLDESERIAFVFSDDLGILFQKIILADERLLVAPVFLLVQF